MSERMTPTTPPERELVALLEGEVRGLLNVIDLLRTGRDGKKYDYVTGHAGNSVHVAPLFTDTITRAATLPQGVAVSGLAAFTGEDRFKRFHRSLCVRFGYVHDEEFWWRDLVSLEEHIAKQRSAEPIGYVRGHELQGFTLGAYGDLEVRHDRGAGDLAVYTSADGAEPDAARWREVSNKAWFVDAAGYAYGLREGSFAPTCDEDDVIAAIDAATTPPPAELGERL